MCRETSSGHRSGWPAATFVLFFAAVSSNAGAQQLEASVSGMRSPAVEISSPAVTAAGHDSADPIRVTAASAILPGVGQVILRQRRALGYFVVEAAALSFYVAQTRDGRRQRERYRQISREVARSAFNPNGPRGDWDYYERMEKYLASGDYDRVPGGSVDPEIDEGTYNGSVWLLARRTYWRDPDAAPDPGSIEYESALRFYENRAVPHDLRWSWVGATESYQKFRSSIAGSNSAFRSAGHTASIVLANHFLSAVDAYVSAQLRIRRNEYRSVSAVVSLPFRY
jgi:hypothetical protein